MSPPTEPIPPLWFAVAKRELGTLELPGDAANPRILEYHSKTTLHAQSDEVPWCSSFVNWCMFEAEIVGTRSASARSWLSWGMKLEEPRLGCITVLRRGSSWQGHVGFFTGFGQGESLGLLGGNQGNAVTITRYNISRVLGYRWPKGAV